jgi:hypothetical protein
MTVWCAGMDETAEQTCKTVASCWLIYLNRLNAVTNKFQFLFIQQNNK